MDIKVIDEECLERIRRLGLPPFSDNSPYVVLSVRGDGVRASPKWNARVYKDKKGRLKLVTMDIKTLQDMLEGRAPAVKNRTIAVDDAGWGFPLGGVMIGATDGERVETGLVPVDYFQGERFERHEYLEYAARVTLDLLRRFNASPDDTLVEICTGYVNVGSKEVLREAGYEVKVVEVKGLLQDELEKRFAEYVRSLGYPGYVDPKETHDPKKPFDDIIRWIEEKPDERMRLAKTGWKYFRTTATRRQHGGHGLY
jgi:putative intracellular protease/amidase